MDRLVETWVSNHFETPYKCVIKLGIMTEIDIEYNILGLKSEFKARIDDILHEIKSDNGENANLYTIANSILDYLTEVSYVEITINGEDGVTIYREEEDEE
jgi:hypothetical protein